MPTSELSDALNPHVVQTRRRSSPNFYVPHLQPVAPPPQEYVPHRSELELAITQPPPAPPQPRPLNRTHPSPEGVQAVQELLRVLSNTREVHDIERKRRLAWEQDLEGKYIQRQAEMERMIYEMGQEISSLRSFMATHVSQGCMGLQFNGYHPSLEPPPPSPALAQPISPVSQPSSFHPSAPSYVEKGSSILGINHQIPLADAVENDTPGDYSDNMAIEPPSPAPSPAPQLVSAEPLSVYAGPFTSTTNQTPDPIASEDDTTDEESYESTSKRPSKRINHHDKRCLTIHQAMRLHILRMMQIDSDKFLPDSHIEGAPLEIRDAVHFVWDKTAKQSVHNGRMKTRILADLKSNRRLYKYVSDKDFSKKTLTATFDQAFTTLRQKFRAQRDESVALNVKRKEDGKALRSRRLGRKKMKLSNRSEARLKLEMFEHVTFDGALQVECMSSEESDNDNESTEVSHSGNLRIRGYAWRSSRLRRFYTVLDDEEKLTKSQMPKRGSGKKVRVRDSDKETFVLPPKGVASWMISKRWLTASQTNHPDLPGVLKKTVVDPLGFDWDHFHALGEESDE